jgi:hypothetical protein
MATNSHLTNQARGGKVSSPPTDAGGLPSSADQSDLPLPHERDEGAGVTNAQPDKVIEQAKRDLDAGLVDTDLRATPGLDAERRDELLDTAQAGEKPQRPKQPGGPKPGAGPGNR